jgi:hypothetical protein
VRAPLCVLHAYVARGAWQGVCCQRSLRAGFALVSCGRCTFGRAGAATAHATGPERGRTVLVTSRRCRLGRTGKGPAADDGADASARANAAHIAQHTLTRNRAERPFAVVAAGPLQHERPGVRPATTRRPGVRPATTVGQVSGPLQPSARCQARYNRRPGVGGRTRQHAHERHADA